MTDLNTKVIADLKRELAEAKAEANRVTESMGSEIMRLHGEIEQQRTRAEAAEQELRDYTAHVAQSKNEDRSKLAAIRAHLQGVDVKRSFPIVYRGNDGYITLGLVDACALIAAAREALEP